MEFSLTFGDSIPQRDVERDPSNPFHILVIGDFGATESWGSPVTVDRDNIDTVFKRLDVNLALAFSSGAPEIEIGFEEFDDFHPDRLFERFELLTSLRKRRNRLNNNETFDSEAAAILGTAKQTESLTPSDSTQQSDQPTVDTSDLLDMAVEQAETRQKSFADQIAQGQLNIDDYARQVVEPYVLARTDPRQPEFIASVDEAIAATMRRLLHHPAFQQLEASWLGLRMLVRRLETDSTLKIHFLNVSKQELEEDLLSNDNLTKSQLYQRLVASTNVAGAEPWSVVVGDYILHENRTDIDLLGRLAKIHAAAGSVFIAGASPSIAGCSNIAETPDPDDWNDIPDQSAQAWQALRSLPATRHVVLMMPRLLARIPYGAKSDRIESFTFEEICEGSGHNDYCWMNGAFGAAALLGDGFSRSGWQLSVETLAKELGGLPLHVYKRDGNSIVKPCAEVELQLRVEKQFADNGLTAIYSIRGQDSVRIPTLRSLSSADDAPGGPW